MVEDRPTVIVVDDSDDVRDILTLLLEDEGYRVMPVEDGETALMMTRLMRPSLITLDLGLPRADGQEILRRLKSDPDTSNIPVLIVSGMGSSVDRMLAAGADGILTKPFDLDEMQRLVTSLIEKDR